MSSHENVARLRDAIAAYAEGDTERYDSFFSEDLVWHVGGNHQLSGDYRGKAAFDAYNARVAEMTDHTLKVEPQTVLASDHHATVFQRVTAQRNGKHIDVLLAQAYRIDDDGLFVEYWALADDQEALDDFWS